MLKPPFFQMVVLFLLNVILNLNKLLIKDINIDDNPSPLFYLCNTGCSKITQSIKYNLQLRFQI